MTINDLCDALRGSSQIKVLSARTGRALLVNAAKKDRREKFGALPILSMFPVIETMDRGSFARPIITCFCDEDAYKRAKEVDQ